MIHSEQKKFGLKKEIIHSIQNVFRTFQEIDKVMLYGSRAKGNYKNGSDVDLTFFCTPHPHNALHFINAISLALDELDLAYSFDIFLYKNIKNDDLKEHIQRVGKIFYDRQA